MLPVDNSILSNKIKDLPNTKTDKFNNKTDKFNNKTDKFNKKTKLLSVDLLAIMTQI